MEAKVRLGRNTTENVLILLNFGIGKTLLSVFMDSQEKQTNGSNNKSILSRATNGQAQVIILWIYYAKS